MKADELSIRENYNSLLKSGMFWEFHPHLTGEWEKDKGWFMAYMLEDMNCGDCKLCIDSACASQIKCYNYSHFEKR